MFLQFLLIPSMNFKLDRTILGLEKTYARYKLS